MGAVSRKKVLLEEMDDAEKMILNEYACWLYVFSF